MAADTLTRSGEGRPGGFSIATAYVDVEPDVQEFAGKLSAGLAEVAGGAEFPLRIGTSGVVHACRVISKHLTAMADELEASAG